MFFVSFMFCIIWFLINSNQNKIANEPQKISNKIHTNTKKKKKKNRIKTE